MYVCGACGLSAETAGYCSSDGQPLAATQDALLGTDIGRYRIARLLGVGGMGQVYLGVQPMIGSRVAIKILSNECTRNAELLERFFSEARAVNLIRHESIVSVIDMAQLPDGRPYIIMEFVEGRTLGEIVRTGEAPIGGIVQVITEILSALGAAHALGIVHRDLKPDNVLITAEGHAKVLDFGIAKLAPGLSNALSPRTRTGALLGTPAYMAPEQISGAENVDARTDLYAAGVVLFEAVTGRTPFQGETLYDLMKAHLEQAPPSPRALRPDLPAGIERVILTALAKNPAHRFQTAADMTHALHDAARELPPEQWRVLSRAPMLPGRPSLEHMRHPTPQQGGAHAPTVRASVVIAPDAKRDQPRRNRGLPVAIAAIAVVSVAVVLVVMTRTAGKAPRASEPVAVATDDTTPPSSGPPAPVAPSSPPITQPATPVGPVSPANPTVARPKPTLAAPPVTPSTEPTGPVIVGDGSAADHGVYIGSGGSPASAGADPKEVTRSADYNPKRFDPVAYLPKARQLARTLIPDAELTSFEFDPVYPDGRVDLTADGRDREYEFRSRARSVLSSGHPRNLPLDRPCRVSVELTATQITATIISSDNCDAKFVRVPRCRFASVWSKARAAGVADDLVARIGWLSDEKWFFDIDFEGKGGGVSSFDDDCK